MDAKVEALAPSKPSETPPAPGGTDKVRKKSRLGRRILKWIVYAIVLVALGIGGYKIWQIVTRPALPPGFAGGNGRLETKQVYTTTKYAGRIAQVLFDEGDTVEAGQVVARMDTSTLEAQLREAEAEVVAAQDTRNAALAQVDVKKADRDYAQKQYDRSMGLVTGGAVSEQEAEVDYAKMLSSSAELVGAQAEEVRTIATIDAAKATVDRIKAQIKDMTLVSPIRARVEMRLAEPGEVLGDGGRVLSLLDLSDVYMYVFLPETDTGKIALGSEARIVLDAAPEYPIRAYVSFISPQAQFTPKTVETAEERHNLTFRVKLQIPKQRLREYEPLVKSGLPGMGYVRTNEKASWPANLEVNPRVPKNFWNPTGASEPKNPTGAREPGERD